MPRPRHIENPPTLNKNRKRSSLVKFRILHVQLTIKSAIMATAEPKQEDMFQSIGDRVNEVSSGGNNAEAEENFTVDEPQIVDNIGINVYLFNLSA